MNRTPADVDRRDAWAVHPVLVDHIPRLVPHCFDSEETFTLIRAGRGKLTRFGQVGTSFGLAITTIVFNTVLERDSLALGVDLDAPGFHEAPRPAQLNAYQAANWGAFAFGILGELTFFTSFLGLYALFVPLCCGGSLGSHILPEQAKPAVMSCDILNLADD